MSQSILKVSCNIFSILPSIEFMRSVRRKMRQSFLSAASTILWIFCHKCMDRTKWENMSKAWGNFLFFATSFENLEVPFFSCPACKTRLSSPSSLVLHVPFSCIFILNKLKWSFENWMPFCFFFALVFFFYTCFQWYYSRSCEFGAWAYIGYFAHFIDWLIIN